MAHGSSAYLVEVEPSGVRWLKSSASSGSGQQSCVELAFTPPTVLVRDSQDRQGPRLTFPDQNWVTFLANCR